MMTVELAALLQVSGGRKASKRIAVIISVGGNRHRRAAILSGVEICWEIVELTVIDIGIMGVNWSSGGTVCTEKKSRHRVFCVACAAGAAGAPVVIVHRL